MKSCAEHIFDAAVACCDRCGDGMCDGCVVHARESILCPACALAMAGVRSSGRSSRAAAAQRRRANTGSRRAGTPSRPAEIADASPDEGVRDPVGVAAGMRASQLVREFEAHLASLERSVAPSGPAPTPPAGPPPEVIDLRDGSWLTRMTPSTEERHPGEGHGGTGSTPSPTEPDGAGDPSTLARDDTAEVDRRRLLALLASGTVGAAAAFVITRRPGGTPTDPGFAGASTPGAPRTTRPLAGATGSARAFPDIPTTPPPGLGAGPDPAAPPSVGSPSFPGATARGGAPTGGAPVVAPEPIDAPPATPAPATEAEVAPPAGSPAPGPAPAPPPGWQGPIVGAPPPATEVELLRQVRLVERITFGPTPELVDQVARLGADRFLDQQLATPPAGASTALTGPHLLDASFGDRYRARSEHDTVRELRHAAVVRAATHPGQLAEMMVAFWSNHFSTYSGTDDKDVRFAAATDDRDVIRRHAMGRFSDLLLASARSISMQRYLDNFRSAASNPNQNYARELLELHTIGEGNGYDEDDVAAVSRVLSGWGLAGSAGEGRGYTFVFQAGRHNSDPATVDVTLPDGSVASWSTPGRSGPEGERDGVELIAWLARLPNTARFVAEKLARRFVSDDPSPALIASTAEVYLANDTAIVPVLRHLLTSAEFDSGRRTKVKTPFELLVGMIRATGARVDRGAGSPAGRTVDQILVDLGHPLWGWPTPDGFPDDRGFWITTNSVMRRWELAGRLANGQLAGLSVDLTALLPTPLPDTVGEVVRALAERLGTGIDDSGVSAVSTFAGAPHDAPLGEIRLDGRLGDIVAMLLSVPAYQFR